MSIIDRQIKDIDRNIDRNIEAFYELDRGLLSQNILSQLRNLVEYVSFKEYCNGSDIKLSYENIKKANNFVKSRSELNFLYKFHKLLQISASHYTLDEENSERLMLKYYEYLLMMKSLVNSKYNLDILSNLNKFPINLDSNLKEYYEKIAEKIERPNLNYNKDSYNDRYYIRKKKPFFIGEEIYYELTITTANDNTSKFDRIIAFTKLNILTNYSVKLHIVNDSINILGKHMPVKIIKNWSVSIRPCEIDNFSKIVGMTIKTNSNNIEYKMLMEFLTQTGLDLVEYVNSEESYYEKIKKIIFEKSKKMKFFEVLDKCREMCLNEESGSNVIRYLLYNLNNKIIKNQYYYKTCSYLSNLNLSYKCIPFDQMPFNSSLIKHNPRISDLYYCIELKDREHELLARYIKNNTESKAKLYTPISELTMFKDIDNLIKTYNNKLYYKHKNRRLETYKGHIYINGYQEETIQIINILKELALNGVEGYSKSVEAWFNSTNYIIDCEQKKLTIKSMFENSRVALIYGAAGTGKSTIINHISNFFHDKKKLYLANTNPAVDNLKRKIDTSNGEFSTINKFISSRNISSEVDVLIIDESSTVSNSDMLKVLNKASYKLLILVGDVFQIESIIFGNWFSVARSFIPKTSIFELTNPYRSNSENLIKLWGKVRGLDDDILEHITRNDYSVTLDETIFDGSIDDEIILCLNYDGLYGINNINKFLQSNNPNESIIWGLASYKIGDPVLFNESDRFAPIIYNNLKGKIIDIKTYDEKIQFDIEIDKVINELDADEQDFDLVGNSDNGNSIIRFLVNKFKSTDYDDDNSDTIVPFQVAYAVSIHKAQGLEYNSVKIVITEEVEENISHNIFYTAITRAKEKLKIYWTPETENRILTRLEHRNNNKDVALLKQNLK